MLTESVDDKFSRLRSGPIAQWRLPLRRARTLPRVCAHRQISKSALQDRRKDTVCRDGGNTFTPERYRLELNSAHTFHKQTGSHDPHTVFGVVCLRKKNLELRVNPLGGIFAECKAVSARICLMSLTSQTGREPSHASVHTQTKTSACLYLYI